ncbi:MAG TPA: aspartyl/asparaginyl beta-hydroxylase domain-containing protein [Cytophagaceae bacterium]|jgi:hypothetical protein|nr:aspartyl/asparaginyl beta-hydroxylase domain-containing protein [Cytophagaceae bacterium]
MHNPSKTKTVLELGPVDISAIREEIANLPESFWDEQNQGKPNNFSEFYQTKHIVFKFVYDLNDCTRSYEFPLWEKWKDKIMPILDQAVKPYGYTNGVFSRIMLAKLTAGSDIKAHKDGNKAATFPHKIHVPIVTNDKVSFFVNPKSYHFKEGYGYEVNNLAVHYVENLGEQDRIHLIFEYYNPDHLPENTSMPVEAHKDI